MTIPARQAGMGALVILGAACVAPERKIAPAEGFVPTADDVQLYYRTLGSGSDTVVVLHGGPAMSMAYLVPDLEPMAQGRTLLFYDQRGSGRSSVVTDPDRLGIESHVADLEALRRHFGLERLTLVGHSWGGGIAALYAIEHPDHVSRLLLVDPLSPRAAPYGEEFERAVIGKLDSLARLRLAALDHVDPAAADAAEVCRERFAILFRPYYADPSAADRSRGDVCDIPPETMRHMETVNAAGLASVADRDWRARARAIRVPTLVVHGAEDPLPVASSREWAGTLPDGRLLVIPKAGHFPYLEQPERFFAATDAFLQGRWPDGADR